MKKTACFSVCVSMLFAVIRTASTTAVEDKACGILNEEKHFDSMSKEKGAREAFLKFLSKDSKILSFSILEGPAWAAELEKEKKTEFIPFLLKASSSCDRGFVAGDRQEKRGETVVRAGSYLNVWKKVDGLWKIVLHSKSIFPHQSQNYGEKEYSATRLEASKAGKGSKKISETVNDFFKTLKEGGWTKAYEIYADEKILKLRNNVPLQMGKSSVFVRSIVERSFLEAQTSSIETSKAEDIAFVYGEAVTEELGQSQKGTFLHIWTKTGAGEWKLLVDCLSSRGNLVRGEIM